MRRLVPALVLAICALSLPGCLRTPESLCHEYVAAMRDVLARCGILTTEPFDVVWPDGMRRGCEGVARVSRADDIVMQCLPWTESEGACADITITADRELVFPAFCDARAFQVYD